MELWAGEFGGEICPYWVFRRSKSSDVVTVFPLIVTIPNSPCPLSAGKYEKAMPPLQISVMGLANSVPTSVQRRGGEVIHPYSLK